MQLGVQMVSRLNGCHRFARVLCDDQCVEKQSYSLLTMRYAIIRVCMKEKAWKRRHKREKIWEKEKTRQERLKWGNKEFWHRKLLSALVWMNGKHTNTTATNNKQPTATQPTSHKQRHAHFFCANVCISVDHVVMYWQLLLLSLAFPLIFIDFFPFFFFFLTASACYFVNKLTRSNDQTTSNIKAACAYWKWMTQIW